MSDAQGHMGIAAGENWPDLIICASDFERREVLRAFPDKAKVMVIGIGDSTTGHRFKNALVMPLWRYFRERAGIPAQTDAADEWLAYMRTRVAGAWATL